MNAIGEIAGRMVKTEYKPDYTLVILRVMDEDNAVFLPAKEVLVKAGVPLADLDPGSCTSSRAIRTKRDKLKFFATSGKLLADE